MVTKESFAVELPDQEGAGSVIDVHHINAKPALAGTKSEIGFGL
jgi:hypothetical protein